MNLKLNLQMDEKNNDRVKIATAKKVSTKTEPSWGEVWDKIMASKLSDTDRVRVLEVRSAIDQGEIGTMVESLKKFTKAHVLRLHKVLVNVRKKQWIEEMIVLKPDNYYCIQNEIEFYIMLGKIKAESYIGLDTETTGLIFEKDYIVGISISLPNQDLHYYIPIRHIEIVDKKEICRDKDDNPVFEDIYALVSTQLPADLVLAVLKPFLEEETLGKVLHNAKFDSHMFWAEGIDLKGILMDTMIAMHVLNENEERYALKILATKYGRFFGFKDDSHTYEELFGKGGFEKTPLDIGSIYAAKDTHLVVELYKWIDTFFKDKPDLGNAYYNIENPLLNVIIHMERNGSLIDMEFANQYVTELQDEMDGLAKQITDYLGADCEFGSNQQLKARLIQMGILDEKAKSVDKDALKYVSHKHEVIDLILEHRALAKLHSTYIVPLPILVRKSGRLHGQFNQHTTVTTRLSSDSPNLQNIPPKARKLFVAPEGKIMVGIDLSQIEPRYLSHISNDHDLQFPFLNGIDLYSSLASKTFKVPVEDCGDGTKYRKMMKVGLLAVMYGISDFELAKSLKITVEEAVQFMEDFMMHYPITDAWINSIHELVEKQEYVNILGGFKRRFPDFKKVAASFKVIKAQVEKKIGHPVDNIWTEKLKYDEKRAYWDLSSKYYRVLRQAVNAIVQGSSATILKYALIKLHEYCLTKGSDWKITLTVHDENILELPDTTTKEQIQELVEIMCGVIKLAIPLKADCIIFKKWGGREIKLEDWTGSWEGEAE